MSAKIKLNAASGGGSVSLKAPSTTTSNAAVELQLPVADGSADQFIKTDGSGNLAFAAAGGGKILQVKQAVKTDVFSESVAGGAVSSDITGLTVTITPSSASNKILLIPSVSGSTYVRALYFYKNGSLISDASGDASGSLQRAAFGAEVSLYGVGTISGMYLDPAGGTSAITYSLRISNISSSTQTLYVNRVSHSTESHSNFSFVRFISTYTVMEVAA